MKLKIYETVWGKQINTSSDKNLLKQSPRAQAIILNLSNSIIWSFKDGVQQ